MNAVGTGAVRGVGDDDPTGWTAALLATLDDAITHLASVIFEDDWAESRARHATAEDALRASAIRYEEGLGYLLRFVRACGLPADAVAWSRLKTDWRRTAVESGVEVTLRTALGEALYAAEATPLGDHAAYRAWAAALTRFLARQPVTPHPCGDEAARLAWAYQALAPLEEHGAFHAAFAVSGPPRATVAWQAALLRLPRFDLVLNAALRWLAEHG